MDRFNPKPHYYRWNRYDYVSSTDTDQTDIDVNDVGRLEPNPCGAIGTISMKAFNGPTFQPGRQASRNYDFDNLLPIVEAHRFGYSTMKYWGVASSPCETVFMSNRPEKEVFAINPIYGPKPIWKVGVKPEKQTAGMGKGLNRPTGLCFDPFGNRVIVADKDNHRIVMFSKHGEYISQFGTRGYHNGQLCYPWDVDVSPDGNQIAVTDSRNHRLQFFDKFGNYVNKYSVFGDSNLDYKTHFDYPRGVTYDILGGSVFVSDFNLHTIFQVDSQTMECFHVPVVGLKRPQGIAMDAHGNLLVCDSKKQCLRVFNQKGETLSVVKTIGQRKFDTPTDIAFLSKGAVLIMDMDGRVGVF